LSVAVVEEVRRGRTGRQLAVIAIGLGAATAAATLAFLLWWRHLRIELVDVSVGPAWLSADGAALVVQINACREGAEVSVQEDGDAVLLRGRAPEPDPRLTCLAGYGVVRLRGPADDRPIVDALTGQPVEIDDCDRPPMPEMCAVAFEQAGLDLSSPG